MFRSRAFLQFLFALFLVLIPNGAAWAEIYEIKLFFGLSMPDGGSVSLKEWETFEEEELASTFTGFSVIDATGYYLGAPERSKVVILLVEDERLPDIEAVAKSYAERFEQNSVLMAKTLVDEWEFIAPD